jgi:anti-sigma factor RsiW
MITCRAVVEQLHDLVSNHLPPERRARVEEHVRLCPGCHAYLESYQVTTALGRRLPTAPLPPGLALQLQALLSANGRAQGRREDSNPN